MKQQSEIIQSNSYCQYIVKNKYLETELGQAKNQLTDALSREVKYVHDYLKLTRSCWAEGWMFHSMGNYEPYRLQQ
jgi:hypothetical protein